MNFLDILKKLFGNDIELPDSIRNCFSSTKKIPCVMKNNSPFPDNMNYYHYSYDAVFSKTNRRRKGDLYAFSDDECVDKLIQDGFLSDGINITKIPFPAPTEAQIELSRKSRIEIPADACKNDVSYILSYYFDKDHVSPDSLFILADRNRIETSYYSGFHCLFSKIYRSFDLQNKIAMFLVCVKHDMYHEWSFEIFDTFLPLAALCMQSDAFMNSYKHNDFHHSFDGNTSDIRNYSCYKVARNYIK